MQNAGETLSSGALALVASRAEARVSEMLGDVSPSELVAAAVPAYPQLFMGSFTASSGERVLLRQRQGQWQVVLQGGAGAVTHRWPVVLPNLP